jgi:hypothetical protein
VDKRDAGPHPEPSATWGGADADATVILAGTVVVATLLAAAGPAAAGPGPAPVRAAAAQDRELRVDVNGDAFSDLAVGVPLEDVGPRLDAGLVNLLEGSAADGLLGSATLLVQGAEAGDVLGVSVE